MSTVTGSAISSEVPAVAAKQRESLLASVARLVETRIWDSHFDRERWRSIVDRYSGEVLAASEGVEFEARMDRLVREAGDLVTPKCTDIGFFHKSRRSTPGRLASHFRYCEPTECSPSATSASDREGVHVFCSRLTEKIGWLKVTRFPGAVGVDVANQIADAFREISSCSRLILDLRGNESGGLAFVRVASYLTPGQRTIGYSVTRYGAEHRSLDKLRSFRWIPRKKAGLLWLAVKYGATDPSVRIETESIGPQPFHGRVVMLIDGRTTGAGERIAAFANDEGLATLVGCRTSGKVICSDSKAVGNDFFVRLPSRAWYTPRKRLIEGDGLEPHVAVASEDPRGDLQLRSATEIVSSL